MKDCLRVTDDDYLISKSIHKSAIKRIIDVNILDITKEYINEQSKC